MAGAGYKLFQTGDVLTATEVNTYLQQQVTMVFANSTARTTALSGVLAEGMMSYLQDTNLVEVYDGSSWVSVGNTGDITEVVAGTGLTGGGTSGAVTLTNDMATTITTKGDLLVGTGSGTYARLGVGTDNFTIVADSGETTGLKWVVDPVADVVTTAGDILYATAADTITRLGIGTAGQVLKVNSGATAPEWGAGSSTPTFVGCSVQKTADQSISTSTSTALTWDSEQFDTDAFHSNVTNTSRFTIPSGKGGYYLISGSIQFSANATGIRQVQLYKNGSKINETLGGGSVSATNRSAVGFSFVVNVVATDYIELYGRQDSGNTLDILSGTTSSTAQISYLGA